jgi:GPH family glycoside/pentoside/hexuronide:cation symporter
MKNIPLSQKIQIALVKQSQYVMTTLILAGSLLIFYTDYIGLNNAAIFGFAVLIFGIWNAVNDPLFGYYSDVRVSKGGLRIPLIKIGMPIMLAGFFLVILVPRGWADWNIFIILLFGLILFDFGKALSMVNYNAFCITIADNPDERAKLNLVISYVSIIPGALIGIVPAYFLTGDFTYIQILLLFLIINLALFVLSYFALIKVNEPSEMYAIKNTDENQSQDDGANEKNAFTLIEGFKGTLGSRPFIILIIWRVTAFFYHGIYYQNIIYMMKWVVPISGIITLLVAGAGGLMINVMYPIIIKLREKIGTIKTIQIGLLMGIPGYIIMFLAKDFVILTIGYVISTIAFSGIFFENVLIGDIADDEFIKTGTKKQGMFYSIYGFFTTLASSLVIFVYTVGLEFFQYDGTLNVQSDFTIFGIRTLASLLPIFAVILCIIIIQLFPLKGERYQELRTKMEKLLIDDEES